MNKLKMHTPSLADVNFTALANLFPTAVTETTDENGATIRAIDKDVLMQEINTHVVDGREERYQFTWPDKRKSVLLANTPTSAALRPVRNDEPAVIKDEDGNIVAKYTRTGSVDFDTTENLYIEGDNLDVLKLLRETYLNRVKIIYIDPPYNTGNDFLYPDDYAVGIDEFIQRDGQYDEQGNRLTSNTNNNGRFHTDWLNMIYPRLRISRDLLTDDGVIFISIDDNEITNLRNVCDDIFGESNFIGVLSVENNPKGRKNSAFVSVSSEYCVIYAKHKESSHFIENIPKNARDMIVDEDGKYVHSSGKRVLVGENNFNKFVSKVGSDKNYSVYYHANDKQIQIKKEIYGEVDSQLIGEGYVKYSSFYNGKLVENTYTENKFRELFKQQALQFSTDKIYEKNFNDTIRIKSQLVNREYEAIVQGKKQHYSMELTTTGAGTYLKNLFGTDESIFPAPKNIGYLKVLISLFEKEPFTVLDFFSGSAATADAVMQLNAEDGGKRKFIMVQVPEVCDEKSVAAKAGYATISEVGKERIRRAGRKIKDDSNLAAQNLDIGFRVLKLDSSNMKDVYYTPHELAHMKFDFDGFTDNIKADRTAEDLLFQVMLELGIPLSAKITQSGNLWCVNGNKLIACFNKTDTNLITEIAKKKPYYAVFRDSSFENDSAMMNFEQVFNTYSPNTIRRVL